MRTAYRLCQVLSTETEGCAAVADPSSLASQGQLSPPKRARKDSRGGYCLQFGFRSGELQGDTEEIKGALLNRGGLDRSRVRVAGISSAMVLAPALMETVVEVVSSTALSADTVTVSFCAPTVIWMSTSEEPAVIWMPSRTYC